MCVLKQSCTNRGFVVCRNAYPNQDSAWSPVSPDSQRIEICLVVPPFFFVLSASYFFKVLLIDLYKNTYISWVVVFFKESSTVNVSFKILSLPKQHVETAKLVHQ